MTHIPLETLSLHRAAPFAGLVRRLSLGLGVRRQRRRLAELDDAQLRDIGLTREAARAEADRPVWDVPQTWLR